MQTVCFWPQDDVGVRTLKIYKDSELYYYQTDTVNTSELPVKIRLSGNSEEWQTLQAKVCDFAGNECWTPELAVYVNTKGAKTVPYQKQRKSAQEEEEQKQAECDSGPRDDQAAHSITAVGGGNVRGAVCCKSRTDPG